MIIREEVLSDFTKREMLLDAAFGASRFEKTCERLREGRLPARGLALVAEVDGEIVGSVRLWHVSIGQSHRALVLGPLAVAEDRRSCGIGGRLVRAALNRAAMDGHAAVLLVGDAPYYARFGFTAALTDGMWLPGPVERARFLALELVDGALDEAFGLVSSAGECVSANDDRPAPHILLNEDRKAA